MVRPTIIINLKTYHQGKALLKLAKTIESVNKKTIIGAPAEEIYRLSQNTKLIIYAQHVDFQKCGRNTGYLMPEGAKEAGAKGVFLNHSEHRLSLTIIKDTVDRCKKIGLKVALFAKDLAQAQKLKKLKPDFLIVEPAELIGGKKSVSKEKPELIKTVFKKLKYPFLIGAGIQEHKDLQIAINLGASGIALASAITTSKNPKKKLQELVNG